MESETVPDTSRSPLYFICKRALLNKPPMLARYPVPTPQTELSLAAATPEQLVPCPSASEGVGSSSP